MAWLLAVLSGAVSGFVGGWFGGRRSVNRASTKGDASPIAQTSGDSSPAQAAGRDIHNVSAISDPVAQLQLVLRGSTLVLSNIGDADALNVEWGADIEENPFVATRPCEFDRFSAGAEAVVGADARSLDTPPFTVWVTWEGRAGERDRFELPV